MGKAKSSAQSQLSWCRYLNDSHFPPSNRRVNGKRVPAFESDTTPSCSRLKRRQRYPHYPLSTCPRTVTSFNLRLYCPPPPQPWILQRELLVLYNKGQLKVSARTLGERDFAFQKGDHVFFPWLWQSVVVLFEMQDVSYPCSQTVHRMRIRGEACLSIYL